MKILNLVYPDKSDIKYKKIRYPDGQQSLTLQSEVGWEDEIKIVSRFNSFLDLELIFCALSTITFDNETKAFLYIPYLLGSRSDRLFENGGTNYMNHVLAPILGKLKVKEIQTLDVHSWRSETHIDRLVNITPTEFIDWCIAEMDIPSSVFISPDKGAKERLKRNLPQLNWEIIQCDKERNLETGEIIKTIVPIDDYTKYENKDFVIVDDICDGGKTFIEIAKEIERLVPNHKGKKYLIVTHGIFSKGFVELRQHFDKIYCTNSVYDINPDERYPDKFQPDLLKYMNQEKISDFVKQLNIF